MTQQDQTSKETADEDLGPKQGTDDATKADMGLTGRPAQSATPVGQGDGAGVGADADSTDDDSTDAASHEQAGS